MDEPEQRLFTVEEANAIIGWLGESLERIREARQVVFEHGEKLKRGATGNGGGAESPESAAAAATLRTEVERITAEGIILRDAETGLVDFPADRDGVVVYLCWRLGEPAVEHWHDPETGFAGRQPL